MKTAFGTHLALALALIGLAAPSTPANAQEAAAEADAEAARVELQDVDVDRLRSDRAYAGRILALAERLAAGVADDVQMALAADDLRLRALLTLERRDEALATVDRSLARRPNEARFYPILWYAALSLDDSPRALAVVEQASRNVPGAGWQDLRRLLVRDNVMLQFNRLGGDKPARVRLAEALFRIGWPGPLEHETLDFLRSILLNHRLEQGDRAAAADFAASMATPSTVASLVVQRRYDALFPPGFDRAARFRDVLEEQDRHTAEALAAAPRNAERVLARSQYLRALGRDAEALALLEPFTRDVQATVASDEQGMWLVNEAAYTLLALGRGEEAVALTTRLAALPMADHPYLISASINHGEVLWEAGRYAESLAHARLLERDFADFASDYGKLWNSTTIVCALAALGRSGEAAPVLERLRAGRDANPAALMHAYLCLDDTASAEALMISRLEGDDPGSALLALQDYAVVNAAAGPDPIVERLLALRERPAVRAALERIGRVLRLPVARTYWGAV